MKTTLIVLLALGACVSAEESDRSVETALNFIKDCKGDYILCVKVYNFIIKVKVISENVTCYSVRSSYTRVYCWLISCNFTRQVDLNYRSSWNTIVSP